MKNTWYRQDFVAGGLGSRKELEAFANVIDAKYGITGLGEVKWVLGMLMERDLSAHTILIPQGLFIDSIPDPCQTPFAPSTHLRG